MEELTEEENLVWLVVAKVEYIVVEMVERWWWKWVVWWKERKKKVVWWCCYGCWNGGGDGGEKGGRVGGGNRGEMVGGKDGRDGRPWEQGALWLLPFAGNKEGEEEIMKERERNGVYI